MSNWPDQSGNRLKQSYIQGFLDISGGNLTIRNNNQLLVGGNTTISGNVLVKKDSYLQGNITLGINTPTTIQYEFESDSLSSVNNSVQCIPAPNFFTSTTLDTSTNIPVGYQTDYLNFKNGTYVTSGSSYFESTTQPFYAFNGSTNTAWQSSSSLYATNGIYSGNQNTLINTVVNGITGTTTISGEWIQMGLPYSVILNSFYLNATNGFPNLFYVMGSNTSYIWNILYTSSNPSYPLNGYVTIPTNIQPYKFFRLVVNSTNPSANTYTSVQQWNLYGIPYLSNVLGSGSYITTNVVYNYGISSSYDGLLSSSALINTNNSVLGKSSLKLNGTNNYLVLPKINVSNSGLSFSFWVYPNTNNDCTLLELNNNTSKIAIRLNSNTNTIQLVNGANTFGSSVILNQTAWTHMVWTITYVLGGTAIHNLYINGVLSYSVTDSYPSITDYYINYLGRSNTNTTSYFNGNIDGFRVYNSTLNIYQINALYNMTGTISINNLQSYSFGNHYFSNNVNILKNVYIGNDLSLNANLNINSGNIWTTATNGNLYTTSANVFIGANTGKTIIQNDTAMNGSLYVTKDVSLNANLFVNTGNIWTTATNANLYTTSANVFIGNSTGKTTIQNDTVMNGSLYVTKDVSLNANLYVNTGNIWTTATNANLYTTSANVFIGSSTGKTTLNGKVTVSNDCSMNGKVTVSNDCSMNGNVTISGELYSGAPSPYNYSTYITTSVTLPDTTPNLQHIQIKTTGITVTLPSPANRKGLTLFIWNNSSTASCTLNTGSVSVKFNGCGRSSTQTADMSFNTQMIVQNDGVNWLILSDTGYFLNKSSTITMPTSGTNLKLTGNLTVDTDASFNANVYINGYLFYNPNTTVYNYSIASSYTIPDVTPNITQYQLTKSGNMVSPNGSIILLPASNTNNNGLILTLYNNTSHTIQIKTQNEDAIYMVGDNNWGISTLNIPYKAIYTFQSDGYNWSIIANNSDPTFSSVTVYGSINTNNNAITGGAITCTTITTQNNNISMGSGDLSCNDITATGTISAVTFNATSDYRIKHNVRKLSIETIDSLKPVRYYNTLSKKEDIGLIAHELQEEYPFLVNGIKDGDNYQSVNYTGIIGLLIKEIQELKKIVADLQNQINSMSS